MEKRWVFKPQGEKEVVERLSHELTITPLLANLLVQRGINTFEEARTFFRPTLQMLHNPFLMKDMDKAIDRIEKAIRDKEKVLIYGDYDVDGTTAVALVYTFFKKYFHEIDFYIPNRYSEGYGVSIQGIDWAHENKHTLIIALDCGIKASEKVDYAKEKGIDFIICDHHLPGAALPNAIAVLDPKRPDCDYPFKELCGCGIGFKLVQAFAQMTGLPFDSLEEYLDLVAVSIAADIVPVNGENRVLTHYGLKRLNSSPRIGFKTIMGLSGFKKELTVSDVVFTIAPRINAAGRIESGKQAVELLISDNMDSARFQGSDINDKNITRKSLDQTISEEAYRLINEDKGFKNRKSTVVYHPDWNKGVIGIVASRLTDRYYRPTVVLTKYNGMVSGSARSVKDFDIYQAIEACSDLLDQFGGHMYAAGLTMKEENVEAFKKKFDLVVSSTIEDRMLIPEIEIDTLVDLKDLTPSFFRILKQFAPFGPGNMAPVFKSEAVRDNGRGRIVGNNHLKLNLSQDGMDKKNFDSIAFQLGHHHPRIEKKHSFDICYHIEENFFNGITSLQLNIKDICFHEEQVVALK